MIISEKVKINISSSNLKHFQNLGYNVNINDEIMVNVSDLKLGSNIKIIVKCDKCPTEKEISYKAYIKNINNGGYYACCTKCSKDKENITKLKIYGEEFQKNRSIKMVNTTIKKFGKEFYRKNTKTKDKFIEEMNIIYKDYNYDFKNINYINNYTKITFICSKHGEISTFPSNLLIGDGCRECKKEEYFLKREKSFFDRLEKIKNPNYDYSMIVYNGMDKNITIKCNIHDYIFQITPKDLLNKRGCKYCGRTKTRLATLNRIENNIKNGFQISPNYNKNACEIFDEISLKENISIQHAMNLGEYYIKELGYWIDGYDKENNVVYEFDEKYHFNKDGYLKEKDLKRQKEIEHFLNCKFIRIKEQS